MEGVSFFSNCAQCSKKYSYLQEAFPGKPVFRLEQSVSLNLPENIQSEKEELCTVLKDLNNQWQDRHSSKNGPRSKPHSQKNKGTTKKEKLFNT